ncbi:hypothetical protein N7508_000957 [Penicillium antarcticum]|uniref:uncharacterized protein n=1 Tax=Penicillium antarcticum TaxID=416450 RepID=UPI00239ADBC3|nr:uncharacterized protein N7508_000957 [Penicillium antarcticum]KAJ5320674.1 hypothetical protein N7508_000957 [Penicillium antarcticum]
MYVPRASWLLAACMGKMINASKILEVDLVFPRNETYTPTEWFPVVFAFQNFESARYLNAEITYNLWGLNGGNNSHTRSHNFRTFNWENSTDEELYLAYDFFGTFNHEGSEVDLVAATVNKSCPGEYGVVIDVTDKTMEVPMWVTWSGGKYTNDTCAVVDYSNRTTPNPCRVDIDATSVASMSASLKARLCSGIDPPDDCPRRIKGTLRNSWLWWVYPAFWLHLG